MKNLVVIGGGFAGFWSAMSAVRQARFLRKDSALKIMMISLDEYLSIRPRFYENKFKDMRVPLKKYLDPLGIVLHVAKVERIDHKKRNIFMVRSNGQEEVLSFDGLILAAGSQLNRPPLPGFEHAFNVDTFRESVQLEDHLKELSASRFLSASSRTFVVVGASFTGLEVITGLPERLRSFDLPDIHYDFILTDRSFSIAPEYSSEGRGIISRQIGKEGIQFFAGEEVDSISPEHIRFKSGKCIETRTIIWCGGLKANPLTSMFPIDRDCQGRLKVDQFLRIDGQKTIFAAGDVAQACVDDEGHTSVMSCQHVIPQGKFAGNNAVNALFDCDLIPYSQPRYVTCLDLGSEQALLTSGWGRFPKMTGISAKELKIEIMSKWIIPERDVEETVKMSVPVILHNEG
jgi:NADH dehydrogenase